MLAFNDPRWEGLKGGYKVPYDPRPALRGLEAGNQVEDQWDELWDELHHQSDVDVASYAAVPHLVRIHTSVRPLGWNVFALVSTIEMERRRKGNPAVPEWLEAGHQNACLQLLDAALASLRTTKDDLEFSSALGFVALARGQFKLGALLSSLDESDIDELVEEHLAWSRMYS